MENKLQLFIQDIGDSVHDAIADRFDSEYENAKTETEYAPYGNTWVECGRYIDDDEDQRIRENFENEYDFDTVMDLLKESPDFKKAVMELVEEIAWQRGA